VNTFGTILFTLVEAVDDDDIDDIHGNTVDDDDNVVHSLVFVVRLRSVLELKVDEAKLIILELKVDEAKLITLELKVDEAKLNDGASTPPPPPATTTTSKLQVFAGASPPIIQFATTVLSSSSTATTTFSKTPLCVLVFFLDLDLVLGLSLVLRGG
jgi:hypothetical protein